MKDIQITIPGASMNEPMLESLLQAVEHARRGRWTNAVVRSDAVEYTYQADWLAKAVVIQGGEQICCDFQSLEWRNWRQEQFRKVHSPTNREAEG